MNHPLHTTPRAMAQALALSLALFATGCTSTTPRLDAAFGQAVREARAAQTLYPQASVNPQPVLGMDGRAATAAQQRYQASFVNPPKTFEVGNIGGGINGN